MPVCVNPNCRTCNLSPKLKGLFERTGEQKTVTWPGAERPSWSPPGAYKPTTPPGDVPVGCGCDICKDADLAAQAANEAFLTDRLGETPPLAIGPDDHLEALLRAQLEESREAEAYHSARARQHRIAINACEAALFEIADPAPLRGV